MHPCPHSFEQAGRRLLQNDKSRVEPILEHDHLGADLGLVIELDHFGIQHVELGLALGPAPTGLFRVVDKSISGARIGLKVSTYD